ncbi:hypothetical protein VOLCADRAFT_90791 [Volvox carteri f. nagariensis]|uniref:Uncharacterized protein n=1 Tax=Volvox carteri f. nagariensis TaxID=3068 RepID=D8TV23_VOLCA|nr:uncharacterized protein VOLCADRAFT_90791 [Volvox carteri f. nagariensis]EFJ48503.1 hypothetical protein VOLCADRAFT_90791 [Volvox carteri f. nagariensis]|eukprot:XP_002950302.1 hypothetical protein VOLCADRAFT_90791 [Volvox carteri f. nagariensis]
MQLLAQQNLLLEVMLRNAPSTTAEDATRFFATLCTTAVPAAGNLLTVGSGDMTFLLHSPSCQLYVRKCYPDLFKAIFESTKTRFVVTGTPRIGKSYFFYYMLLRLLHSPSPPPFILWEHFGKPGVVVGYTLVLCCIVCWCV